MRAIIFLMLILLFSCELKGSSIKEVLDIIPTEHQEDLKCLFNLIFLQQDGAYTIFGDKPVSLSGAFIIASWRTTLRGNVGNLTNLWKIWQNYQHLFHLKKYLIIGEKRAFEKTGLVALHIFVINKQAFVDSIERHLTLFETVLDRKIIPEEFLKEIETAKTSIWKSINQNEMLLGILLGYGKHNASLFNKKSRAFVDSFCVGDAELKSIQVKLEPLRDENHPMLIVSPVQFAADLKHSETIGLEKKYKDLRNKIALIYSQGDFLEITLSQLTSGSDE